MVSCYVLQQSKVHQCEIDMQLYMSISTLSLRKTSFSLYLLFNLFQSASSLSLVFIVMLQVGWSVEGLQRMERHGRLHLPTVFQIQLEQYDSAGADCLQQVHPTIPPSSPPPPPSPYTQRVLPREEVLCTNAHGLADFTVTQIPRVVIVTDSSIYTSQLM